MLRVDVPRAARLGASILLLAISAPRIFDARAGTGARGFALAIVIGVVVALVYRRVKHGSAL